VESSHEAAAQIPGGKRVLSVLSQIGGFRDASVATLYI
jgi:hypothetical protein